MMAPAAAPLLSVRELRKAYAGRAVLDLDALALFAGRSYALTGDNGSGKSTLLRVLAGLETAHAGAMEFHGRTFSLQAYPEDLRHEIVYVHQHPYLFRTSIEENIAYGLKARGMGMAQRASRVEEAMAWAGVGHLRGVPAQKLSGGEKQRVALARARVLEPRLFLLDEPTANLDGAAVVQVIELIGKLREENNCVVVACHDREIIDLPGMEGLHLAQGRIG